MTKKRNTYFIDIDGTILHYENSFDYIITAEQVDAKLGVTKRLQEIHSNGDEIILTTARLESMREITLRQLQGACIIYDRILFGVGNGTRYIINDRPIKSDREVAVAITVDREIDTCQF